MLRQRGIEPIIQTGFCPSTLGVKGTLAECGGSGGRKIGGRRIFYIPTGTFLMGPDPGVEVTLTRGYFMDRTEVSVELRHAVRNWALAHGYADIGTGAFRAAGHPIQTLNWYDCVKWCNTRRESDACRGR